MSRRHILTAVRMVLFIMAIIVLLIFVQLQINKVVDCNQIILDDHWTVTMNGKSRENVDLSKMFFSDVDRGETIEISRVLPDDGFRRSSISMLLRYSRLEVFLDGEKFEGYNEDNYAQGNLLGNGIVWIGLPEDYRGKTLTMRFTFGEKNSFTSFDTISLVNTERIPQIFVGGNLFSIMIVSFLMIFGFFSILAGINLRESDDRNRILIVLGVFAWSSGIWLFCNSRISSILIDDFRISGTMEYCAIYIAFVSMVFFLWLIVENAVYRVAFKIWGYILCAVFTTLIVLNCINVLHFPATVHWFQLSGVITTIIGCIVLVNALKEQTNARAIKHFLLGFLLFLLFVILELIRYRYNHKVSPSIQLKQSFVPFGVAFFIICMFISFVGSMYEQIYKNIEKKKLYDMAYFDHLTGLRNRAWCDNIMRKFETEAEPVSILNFDLDYFKEVNDTYGHLAGDELLKSFGRCLSSVFREADCVGRMGGDEFVVILKYVPEDKLHRRIEELSELIKEENAKLAHGQIQFSVGIATSQENENVSIWKLYEQADRQMYEYKQSRR